MRAIDARNAFVMNSLLQEVTRSGTAASAKRALGRGDIFGKTGTTNDSMDAWFAGFHPSLVAVVWIGYDTPRKLGDRETGGGLALPVWIDYMAHALKGVPVQELDAARGRDHRSTATGASTSSARAPACAAWAWRTCCRRRPPAKSATASSTCSGGDGPTPAAPSALAPQRGDTCGPAKPVPRCPLEAARLPSASGAKRSSTPPCSLAWRDSASKKSLPSRVSSQRPCTWR